MMIRIDHLLIRTDNLSKTVKEFCNMGFKVYYGNNKKKCHHAMIYFKDQTFIEFIDQTKFPFLLRLLARKKILNLLGPFFSRISLYVTSTNRYLDYSFYNSDIENFYHEVKKHTKVSKLITLNRLDFSNKKLTWKLFSFNDVELPFMMSDYIPKKYPEKKCTNHPNGVNGISRISLTTKSSQEYLNKLSKTFNLKSENNLVQLENTQIQITESKKFEINSAILSMVNKDIKYDFSVLSVYNIFLIKIG